ncbi:HNH endonuclease [Streptomyces phage Comrade]|uniref:HNH endonuclease n=2 Tax=Gilsonvirus comrade TaxID=2846395 RepID=A0A345ME53_9CAUD|nr:HNH endonuclease [Streptomyces phage Comrade]AXH68834.1 HNH endonuclease [Streptomyces phage SparkleGoddess]AXQ63390.1 HNH endonuclease [Streptomyces phage Comrade]
MSESLGRPLEEYEEVHHKNGDRLDNRLENLELWVRRQPPGQRAEDLLEWAYEIIRRYGDENDSRFSNLFSGRPEQGN